MGYCLGATLYFWGFDDVLGGSNQIYGSGNLMVRYLDEKRIGQWHVLGWGCDRNDGIGTYKVAIELTGRLPGWYSRNKDGGVRNNVLQLTG